MKYYDAEIEYLESTGTQYINTLTTYNSDTDSLELEYAYTNRTISGDNMIIGVKGDTNRLTINTYYSPTLYIGFGNVANRVNLADTSKTYIVVKNKKCFSKNINDELVTIADWSLQDTFTTNIIYLFADNYIDSVKYQHKGIRIKRFKIDNKIDLIPVRIGSVGYMYDKVSDTLFGNAGTGLFTLGPDTKVNPGIIGTPKVSFLRRKLLQFMPSPPKPNYLRFTALEEGTFTFTATAGITTALREYVEYSVDEGITWTRFTKTASVVLTATTPTILPGKSVLWRGIGTTSANNNGWAHTCRFSSTGKFNVSGILASLFYGESFTIKSKTKAAYYAARLFYGCTKLINAKDLILSPLGNGSTYYGTFAGCTNLLTAPNLALGTALVDCFRDMFNNCSKLSSPINLPTIILANTCYYTMFSGCTNLNKIKMLAVDINYTNCLYNWLQNVLNTSSCIFIKNIYAPWTTTGNSGVPTNWTIIYYDTESGKYYLSDKTTECDEDGNVIT